jgi:hypothetical protein
MKFHKPKLFKNIDLFLLPIKLHKLSTRQMQESYFGTKIAVISDNPGYIASELIQAFTGEEKFIEHDGEQIKDTSEGHKEK